MAQYKDGTYIVKDGEIYKIDIKVKWPIDGITVPLSDFIKKTNADRIRAMTDEELAEWVSSRKETCPPIKEWKCSRESCHECWLAWLKQDANNA